MKHGRRVWSEILPVSVRRSGFGWIVLVAVATVAACDADGERPDSAGEQGASGPAADSVARAYEPGFGPDGGWVLTPTRAGPVIFGASAEEVERYLEDPPPDVVTPPNDCRVVRPVDGPAELTLMVDAGRIVRADVTGGPTTTAEGVPVGATAAHVLELYPEARRQPHKYTDGFYLIVMPLAPADTLHRYVFETDGARVTRFRSGMYPQVEWVEGCS